MKNILLILLSVFTLSSQAFTIVGTSGPLVEINLTPSKSLVIDRADYNYIFDTTKSALESQCHVSDYECRKVVIREFGNELKNSFNNEKLGSDQGEGGWSFEGKVAGKVEISQDIIMDISFENMEYSPEMIVEALLKHIQKEL